MSNTPIAALLITSTLVLAAPSTLLARTEGGDQSANPVTLQYQTGGLTAAGRERMDKAAKDSDYDLQIHLTGAADGDWTDADVLVKDSDEMPVIHSHAGGPWFYARLPHGTYTVDVKKGRQEAVVRDLQVTPGKPTKVDAKLAG